MAKAQAVTSTGGYVVERSDDFGDTWVPLLGPTLPDGTPIAEDTAVEYAKGYRAGLPKRSPVRVQVREA